MATTAEPARTQPGPDWDLPAVPGDDFQPAWDQQLTGSHAEALREFAEWVRAEGLPDAPDAQLVKFVHSCDYDLEKAKKCAKDFYWCRKEMPDFFTNWDTSLPNIQGILDVITVAIVPRRTPDNSRVIINSLRTSDTTNYVIADVCKVSLMLLETIFLTEPTVGGIVMIHDLDKVTFSHFFKMLWSMPKKMQVYMEDGIPIKRDRVHLVNCPGLIDKALKLMRHMGRQEDWDRMRVHKGGDYTELHSLVPPECLPSELGGTQPSLEDLHDMTVQRLADFKEIFRKHS
ncbi:alpha-tocopherol transfer protein-like [Thrips palmi]|uniref:Alpha-tocopherol transfer protein-like n=1 Tax=Thrips palmi TaxID=161013 RepID=A0A6P8Z2Q3_THRPL|nr:alpha-tocopherol transfer protein-like [Thrips palmi]